MSVFARVKSDALYLYKEAKSQDFAFWMAALYLIFTYMKPQVTFPALDFLPWIQITILVGLAYLLAKGRLSVQIAHVSFLFFFYWCSTPLISPRTLRSRFDGSTLSI